jgi:hypothetical protein
MYLISQNVRTWRRQDKIYYSRLLSSNRYPEESQILYCFYGLILFEYCRRPVISAQERGGHGGVRRGTSERLIALLGAFCALNSRQQWRSRLKELGRQ